MLCNAKGLLKQYWDMKIPIDPEDCCSKLQLKIVKKDLQYCDGYLDGDNKTIYINNNLIRSRERYTIALQLAHYCLQHKTIDIFNKAYSKQDQSEANKFALDLLIPSIAIAALVQKHNINDPVKLRKAFDVTSVAMYNQLKRLGYFL